MGNFPERRACARSSAGSILSGVGASSKPGAVHYKRRWAIKLFFRWVKQTLKIRHFLGTSENAVRIQIAVALIAFLLAQASQETVHSPLAFARLVRANLMHRRRIDRLLEPEPPQKSATQIKGRSNGTDRPTGQPWAGRGFADRLGIIAIILAALDKRFDVLRRDQPHLVAEPGQSSSPMMRAAAGLQHHLQRQTTRENGTISCRRRLRRSTARPPASMPCRVKTDLDVSIAVRLISVMDGSCSLRQRTLAPDAAGIPRKTRGAGRLGVIPSRSGREGGDGGSGRIVRYG